MLSFYKKSRHTEFRALEVKVRYTSDDEKQRDKDLEKALSTFKKIINKEGLMQEMREREYFKSPGRKRYEAKNQAAYKRRIDELKAKNKFKKRYG